METKGRLGLLTGTVGKTAKAVRGWRLVPHETSKRNLEQGNLATSGLTTETGDPANLAVTAALLHETGLAAWSVGMCYTSALVGTFAVVTGLWTIVPVFIPVFLALCMALTLYPASQWLISRKVPAALVVLLNIVSMLAVVLGVTGMIAGALTAVIMELPRYQCKFQILYQDSIHLLGRLGDHFNIDMSLVTSPAQRVDLGRVTSYARSLANSPDSAGTTMFYFTMLAIFLVGDLVVMRRHAAELAIYASGSAISLRKFVRGTCMCFLMAMFFGAGVAVLNIIVMYILETPSSLTWRILAFVANYILAVGFIISTIPPVLMVLVTQGVGLTIGAAVSFIVTSTVVFNSVQPCFTGSAVGLNPTISFLPLMVRSVALGPLGAAVSAPMILPIKAIFVDSGPHTVWIDVFLRPSDTPPADLLRRKRDRDRDGHDDRTGEAAVVDRRTHEQQVRETAEAERQRAQATVHGLNEAA